MYNPTNKTCDTIVVFPNITFPNTTTNGNTTSTPIAQSVERDLSFIPLPFFIFIVVASIFIFILHFKNKLVAIPMLYAVNGLVLTFSNLILIAIGIFSNSFEPVLAKIGLYVLLGAQSLVFLLSCIAIVLYVCRIRCEKWGVLVISVVHYSGLALLTSNFSNYNSYFMEGHRPFWKKYKKLSKVGFFVHAFFIVGAILQCFGIEDRYSYSFFAAI